ncbi:MnuA family membrane nuclease [Malacoplasma muris]|uniref:MnuA family membrane nuclease n=1 Tax=Malacoplasma muris TaxID=2119 RepID=UPI00398E9FC6
MGKKRIRKQNKILYIILIFILLCLIGGVIYYFIFYKENVKSENNNKPLIDKPIGDNLYSVNQENGFIIKNYSLVEHNILENPAIDLYDNDVYKYIRYSVSDHNPIGFNLTIDQNEFYKIGHWNTLNFNLLKNNPSAKEKEHAMNIAKIVNYFKFDLIGMTEINKNVITEANAIEANNPASNFVNLINDLVPESRKNQYHYNIIVSKNTNSLYAKSGQSKQVAILYNTKKFKLSEANNTNDALIGSGTFYSNASVNDNGIDRDYVRAPFGSKFQTINNVNNKEFVVSFSHFDSPGSSQDSVDYGLIDGIGKQEYFEAQQIDKVIEEFRTLYNTNNVIFMGDTNIKTGKQNLAFNIQKLSSLNYKFAFDDNDYYNTSLATVATVNKYPNDQLKWYSNAYDKIIYRLDEFQTTIGK